MTRPIPRWRHAIVLLGAAALLAACGTPVVNPVTGRSERSVMTQADEIAEGRKAHAAVLAEYGAYDHPRLQAYVNELGQRLARQSHRADLPWTFTVLDSPEVNAFALPGGFVYVTRGILAHLDSEAELAGVIGHEIGHVTARHGAQRATRAQSAGLGVLAATVLGVVLEQGGVGGAADLASQVSQAAAAGYIASYSRDQELQADRLGAEYLARTSYDPRNMVHVIGVLKAQEVYAADRARAEGRAPPQGAHWLSSHPSNDQRLAEIRAAAARVAGGGVRYGDDQRARYLAAIDGMTYGDGRAQGVVRGRQFFHEELGIALTAPVGWRIQNGRNALSLVAAAGDAGLVLRTVPPQAGRTHDEILRNVVKPTAGRVERRQINGLAATAFSGTVAGPQGRPQDVRLTVVSGPGGRNYLLIHAARDAAALQRAAAGLAQAEASFRPLSAAERAAARPWVVRSVPFPRGGWDELARMSALGPQARAELRLINGVYDGGADPRPGEPVKQVR
jgi:predicted Zn-dependent protease